jgi:hypothetical protein
MQPDVLTSDRVAAPSRPKARRLLVAAVALAILAGLLALFWQWRSPGVFEPGAITYQDRNWPVGEPIFVGVTHEPRDVRGSIEIHGAEPEVVRDSAGVRVDYLLCTINPSGNAGSVGAVIESDIDQECSSLTSIQGRAMELNADPRQQVVMSVTPTKPGTVEIEGTELSFSFGWRRGSQFMNDRLILTAVQ